MIAPSLTIRPLVFVALAFALSACGAGIQMPRMGGMAMPRAAAPVAPLGPEAAVTAGRAEAACTEVAQAQGLGVQSIVGTREVTGADGVAVSRDVMLRVARGQQVYDVRCSYSYGGDAARIMSL